MANASAAMPPWVVGRINFFPLHCWWETVPLESCSPPLSAKRLLYDPLRLRFLLRPCIATGLRHTQKASNGLLGRSALSGHSWAFSGVAVVTCPSRFSVFDCIHPTEDQFPGKGISVFLEDTLWRISAPKWATAFHVDGLHAYVSPTAQNPLVRPRSAADRCIEIPRDMH